MKPEDIKAKRVDAGKDTVRILIAGRASYFDGLNAVPSDPDNPESKKVFKSGILVPKAAPKAVFAVVNQGVKDAIAIGIKKKWKGVKPVNVSLPLRNGDEKYAADPEKHAAYKGVVTLNAKRYPRSDVDRPILRANGKPVTESGIIESGDWCVFDIEFYAFDSKGNKGVAVSLNAVTLIEQGERFGGGVSEQSVEDEASALYGDLLASSDDDVFGEFGGLGEDEEDDFLAGL